MNKTQKRTRSKKKILKDDDLKKKTRTISFANEDGHKALKWLDEQGALHKKGKSGLVVQLLLEDRKRKKGIAVVEDR